MSGRGEIVVERAMGGSRTHPEKSAPMRTHLAAATPRRDGFSKPIPDILAIIKDSYAELRPAERRVRAKSRDGDRNI